MLECWVRKNPTLYSLSLHHTGATAIFAREVNSIQPKADPPQVEVNLQASAP